MVLDIEPTIDRHPWDSIRERTTLPEGTRNFIRTLRAIAASAEKYANDLEQGHNVTGYAVDELGAKTRTLSALRINSPTLHISDTGNAALTTAPATNPK